MKVKKINDTYVIKLERGEKIIETLKNFCSENNIFAGYFFGIGALDEAELAHYIVKSKKYNYEVFRQPLEIVNLSGNITTMSNEVYLHCHATLSDVNMEAIAGHLKEGTIAATCEIILVKLNAKIERKYDDFIGLNLMDL
ncbi:DNA-binding protein [Candidatus Woesearchaeota archaeon]|nr:DNA-binding protein [Candidatus Woesearchaeota archaeon]